MKNKFPIFSEKEDLVYLDSAATTHKPKKVIDAIVNFYSKEYATVHRGLYGLAFEATSKIEETRKTVADFIGAKETEIVFTAGATESANLVAYGNNTLEEDDEILVSILEHHSNLLPWKMLAKRKNAKLITFGIDKEGRLDLKDFKEKISLKTKIVAVSHQSNVFGITNPIKEITKIAHSFGAIVVVDGAQQIAHDKVDVKDLDADFYFFSAHKMYGPTGVGILYGKYDLLDKMDPFLTGGGMVEEETTFRAPPHKFEAGTPMIASIIGLKSTIEFIEETTFEKIKAKETVLSMMLYDALKDKVEFLTPLCRGTSILSFTLKEMHPSDLSILLSLDNISFRVGNMCAQPLLKSLNKPSIIRISLGVYNDKQDIDSFLKALNNLKQTT